jgi:hypothetical protein
MGRKEGLQRAELLFECGFRTCLFGGWYFGLVSVSGVGARGADEERSVYI